MGAWSRAITKGTTMSDGPSSRSEDGWGVEALSDVLLDVPAFSEVLDTVRQLDVPEWVVGGGVIRDVVWNALTRRSSRAASAIPWRDVDVAFYDPVNIAREFEADIESKLSSALPNVTWDVKNQARVHLWFEGRFGFAVKPLRSLEEAVSTWPETCTAIGVRLEKSDDLTIIAPFGVRDLLSRILRRNPRRVSAQLFEHRLKSKNVLSRWPDTKVIDSRGGGMPTQAIESMTYDITRALKCVVPQRSR